MTNSRLLVSTCGAIAGMVLILPAMMGGCPLDAGTLVDVDAGGHDDASGCPHDHAALLQNDGTTVCPDDDDQHHDDTADDHDHDEDL